MNKIIIMLLSFVMTLSVANEANVFRFTIPDVTGIENYTESSEESSGGSGLPSGGGSGSGTSVVFNSFAATPDVISGSGTSTLTWDIDNATTLGLYTDPFLIFQEADVTGQTSYTTPTLTEDTTYYLVYGTGGSDYAEVTILVQPEPELVSFTANRTTYNSGQTVTLSWNVTNPGDLFLYSDSSLTNLIAEVTGQTSYVHTPTEAVQNYYLQWGDTSSDKAHVQLIRNDPHNISVTPYAYYYFNGSKPVKVIDPIYNNKKIVYYSSTETVVNERAGVEIIDNNILVITKEVSGSLTSSNQGVYVDQLVGLQAIQIISGDGTRVDYTNGNTSMYISFRSLGGLEGTEVVRIKLIY